MIRRKLYCKRMIFIFHDIDVKPINTANCIIYNENNRCNND